MTARIVRATGAMAIRDTIMVHDTRPPAQRGDDALGDDLIALGYWIDAQLDRALAPLGAFAAVYFAGHIVLAWARGLL